MKKKILLPFFLLLLLTGCFLMGPSNPDFFTTIYNSNIYYALDVILNHITRYFPFSIGDILYAALVIYGIYKTYLYLKRKEFKKLLLFSITYILLFFTGFQLFWGLNNYKYSVAHQLKLELSYTPSELDSITEQLIDIVNTQLVALNKNPKKKVVLPKDLDLFNKIAQENYKKLPVHLKNILTQNTINNVKPSFYSSLQSYTGFSGYFNPFTHENQLNIEIPVIGMPITVAHEIAHQQGIASEAEANFYGYQVMLRSEKLEFKYAANLYALKYCLKEYRTRNEEIYLHFFSKLHPGAQQNILDSEAFWQSKRTISSFIFKQLYGRFLKINNQKEGIKSYNKFVDLLINYNKKYGSF